MKLRNTRTIKGQDYTLVVLNVLERDSQGRPSKVTVGYDDTMLHIKGGENFWIVYAPVGMATRNTQLN